MQEFKPVKEGKVREVYDNGDSLIIDISDNNTTRTHNSSISDISTRR